jgi:putative hemolysin
VVNGALAGSEIAVVSIRKTRLEQLLEGGRKSAGALKRLRQDPEAFLATVQIGITIIGASAGAFGGASIAEELAPIVARVDALRDSAEQIALAIVIGGISFLSLVVGELVPKSLALRAGERYALVIARPLLALSIVAKPLVWFLTAASNVILRLFGDRTTFTESRLSPGEIQQLVDEATEAGAVDRHVGEIASRAFDFVDLQAMHVMVPRQRVIGIPRGASHAKLRDLLLEHGKTRMPVYEDIIDNVVGYVTVRDLLALFVEKQLFTLEDALRPAFKVPESIAATELLSEMRRRHTQLAIVVDEAGATSGIVTIEDLVEELVGEIADEHEVAKPPPLYKEVDGSVVVMGDVPVRDVNRELELDLPESEEWTTIAGLCLSLAGRIPRPGERFKTEDGTELEITAASPRQIKRVRVLARPSVAAS